jgi:cellulose biosynthesis protein BcsQ
MYDHADLAALQANSLRLQDWIRRQTYSPEHEKVLRRFSAWEVAEHILRIPQAELRAALAADPDLPRGEGQGGGQRWFSLEEIEVLRARLSTRKRPLRPHRPAGKRAVRAAVANFKGGAGKSTVALHFAHAAALDGYRVLLVDFDPQATLSHSMGLTDTAEDATVWGIMARDLARETERMNAAASAGAASGARAPRREVPPAIKEMGLAEREVADFIRPTPWPVIDMIPSCANAAFVEFASAQYRHLNPDWSFFAAVSRYLDALPDDAYDLILFDCPPAIGYQSVNAVFAADLLYIPSGPGYWEYDSTTSFIGQLSEALEDLALGREAFPTGKISLPKQFQEIRFLLTRFEPGNDLHAAMFDAFRKVFGDHLCEHPIEHTRAVEQSGRFLCSVYEIDYRDMTRDTWKRARRTFDRAYGEFAGAVRRSWEGIPESGAGEESAA